MIAKCTKPTAIKVGENLKEFLELDTKVEEDVIVLYKKIIEHAQKEGDVTTAFIFKEILEDEERTSNSRPLGADRP